MSGLEMPGRAACGCAYTAGGHRYLVWCQQHKDEAAAKRDPLRPAIDRALDGDHRLCGLEPCSDCR